MSAPPPVGLLVEGETEMAALPKLRQMGLSCPHLVLRKCKPLRGDAAPVTIARIAAPYVRALRAKDVGRVVFCFDREHRDQDPAALAEEVYHALRVELGGGRERADWLHVIVANRAFEAWILADAAGLTSRKDFKSQPCKGRFEGQLGERRLLGVAEITRGLGSPYRKTFHGPRLFGAIELDRARDAAPHATGSASLDRLLRVLVGEVG